MIIAIDLGATGIKVAPFERTQLPAGGDPLAGSVQTVPTDADLGKEGIVRALDRAISLYLSTQTEGIAVASAGDVDPRAACITYATENLPGMTGFSYADYAKKYDLPISAINDAHAALLGELYDGAGKDHTDKRVVMLTLGSGVGGAYAVDGKIVSTKENDYARFGHICLEEDGFSCTCGKKGCAEMYMSGRAIHRQAAVAGIDDGDLFQRYLEGEQTHVAFMDRFRLQLAQLLEKVAETSPFDVCIIGGGVADWMGDAFDQIVDGFPFPVIRATLGNRAGVYGAYRHFNSGEVSR